MKLSKMLCVLLLALSWQDLARDDVRFALRAKDVPGCFGRGYYLGKAKEAAAQAKVLMGVWARHSVGSV